jgi:uncharacterized membrane protein
MDDLEQEISTLQKELRASINQKRDKFIYYVIGITVSAIGFSVYKTQNQALSILQLPLGIAILFWLSSIHFGFRYIQLELRSIIINHSEIEDEAGAKKNDSKRKKLNDSITTKFTLMTYSFYFGIISFLIWRLIEMYNYSPIISLPC